MGEENYLKTYLKNRPLFLSIIRSQEAKLFQEHIPFKRPVLDFGCGDGFFAKVILEDSGKIDIGIDVDRGKLKEAKKEKVYKKTVCYDGNKLPFPDKFFSTVISNCVLEHIDDLEKSLFEIYRVLKPGGKFICTVMTDKWEDYLFGSLFLGNFYKKWMRKKQVHEHLLSKKQWDLKFKKARFKIDRVVGYMGKRASRWMDFLHYVSIPSLVSCKFFGKWALFPQRYDLLPIDKWLKNIITKKILINKSAALFFVLTK